ncbi:MAG TPA: tetratricopeptide repeat protein [Ignavibacteriaceae bacterium]|nr:tetratricopeptide repeat protein [Ignavibacteriaceae bacterium]
MNRRNLFQFKFIPLISALILLSGCSLWQNFTTYFNLYYNTNTLFKEAEEDIFSQKRDLFSTEPLIVSGAANAKLVKVIEKCSKILQFHATTSYVDDALMMLGKSFYYQKNFQKAKRKFEELLAIEPDNEMRLEADYWIAKCNMSLRDFTNGLSLLEDTRKRAIEVDNDDIIYGSFIEEITHRISNENYTLAIALAEEMLPFANSQMKSKIYFELGKLYINVNDLDKAILAYENVLEFSPDFDLEIAENINNAIALRDAGRNDQALIVFKDMRRKDKFLEKYNEIDLETAITLEKLGRYEEALEEFTKVDTSYRNTPVAAASSYYKGRIYEYTSLNYDSAAFYYQKAFTSNPPQKYQQQVRDKNQLFNKYFNLRGQVDNYNNQLFYSENPEIFIQDSIDYVQDSLKLLSDYLAEKELQDIWSNVFQSDPEINDSLLLLDSLRIQDSIQVVDSLLNLLNLGLFADTNEVNTALIGYFRTKDSLHVRDSLMTLLETGVFLDTSDVNRVLNEYFMNKDKQAQLTPDSGGQQPSPKLEGVNLDSVAFKNNPPRRPSIPIDSVKYIIVKLQLELGNLFLAEIDVPDSAYVLYSDNIQRFPESDFYPNTVYALGSYYQTQNNQSVADSLFLYLYDNYKNASIVNAAAFKLDLPLIDLEYDPAKTLYISAESQMIAGNYELDLKEFLSIYRLYPESDYSPKGLYAAGWVLEKDLQMPDSAAVVYDTLSVKYAASVYSREVAKKLGGYKQEIYRKQKEEQERLSALQTSEKDSIPNDLEIKMEEKPDSIDYTAQAFVPDVEELRKNEEEKRKEALVNPDLVKPEDRSPVTKLEALWNPRKPR